MDETKETKEEISRRTLLKSVPMAVGVVAAVGATAMPEMADAQTKLSHQVAKYQDTPHNGQECSTCLQFEPPNACKIVASPITPHGWCQFYAKKS